MTLYELREEYKQLLIMLEDEGADPEVIADTLEGMEGDINEKVDSYCIIAEQLSSDADRLRAEEVRLAKRRKSIEGNRDRLRAALLKAMLIMEKPQIKTDRYTVTVKATSGRLVIDDPLGIPEEYIVLKSSVDEKAVKDALKKLDIPVPWAHIETDQTIQIR